VEESPPFHLNMFPKGINSPSQAAKGKDAPTIPKREHDMTLRGVYMGLNVYVYVIEVGLIRGRHVQ
jgi:hypothetical protein